MDRGAPAYDRHMALEHIVVVLAAFAASIVVVVGIGVLLIAGARWAIDAATQHETTASRGEAPHRA